ncbi:MAG: flippase-like domain-containing protein [Gammaproteobacteria bacterium]|nr:flippase-like domain-containing protein [Gammaproteobacteria bacterium]
MLKSVIKIVVSGALIALLAYSLEWQPVLDSLAQANKGLVGVALILQVMVFAISSGRWSAILATHDLGYNVKKLIAPTFIGCFFNNLLPSATGGDMLRAYYIYRHGHGSAIAISPIITERVVGLAVMIGLATLALPFLTLSNPLIEGIAHALPWFLFLGVLGLVTVGMRLSYRPLHHFFGRWDRWKPVNILLHITEACHTYLNRPRLVLKIIGYSAVIQVLEIVGFWLLGLSVGSDLSFYTYLLIVPLVLVASSLPVTVGGLGVREAAAVSLFAVMGMSRADGAAVALLFLVALVVASLPGLYFFLTMKDHKEFLSQADQSPLGN